jgi:hypothetical protein
MAEGHGFEMNQPEPSLACGKLRIVLPEMVRRLRRKMHSPTLSRATEAAHEILPNKNIDKISGILGASCPGNTATRNGWRRERNWDRTFSA